MRKLAFFIYAKTKADQLHGKHVVDMHLCVLKLLSIKNLKPSSVAVQIDKFCRGAAHLGHMRH